jgi:hypothetical protein
MHQPAATIRPRAMLPLRFVDGFGTTARVYTSEGLPAAGSIPPSAWPATVWPRRSAEAHARWTSRAMRCSTPRRRAQPAVDF